MSWTDKKALDQIKKFRDYHDISIFIETGAFRGVNAAVHANNFKTVITCEKVEEYYWQAKRKLFDYTNVFITLESSPSFLFKLRSLIRSTPVFIYLDAHFYDPTLPKSDRWVVLKELAALQGTTPIIAIHDFDCSGLGHLTYDDQPLNFELVKEFLYRVNPMFNYYVNTKKGCDPITKERVLAGEIPNLTLDPDTEDNIEYMWSNETKTYRGILYCTPAELDITKFELTKLKV